AREWQTISRHPLDFCHAPSCMGHTSAIGLGLALAQPSRHVIVLNGDGSMLMSLGNLVTIAAAKAGFKAPLPSGEWLGEGHLHSGLPLTPALSPEGRGGYQAASNFTLIVCDN